MREDVHGTGTTRYAVAAVAAVRLPHFVSSNAYDVKYNKTHVQIF